GSGHLRVHAERPPALTRLDAGEVDGVPGTLLPHGQRVSLDVEWRQPERLAHPEATQRQDRPQVAHAVLGGAVQHGPDLLVTPPPPLTRLHPRRPALLDGVPEQPPAANAIPEGGLAEPERETTRGGR